jgi:high-affinity iron transporter
VRIFLAVLLIVVSLPTAANPDVMRTLHMLDYIGVDYGEFVQNGEVLSELEYEEQKNFAAAIEQRLRGLTEHKDKPELLRMAADLRQAIDDKAPGDRVKTMTTKLTSQVLAAYPVEQSPRRPPDVAAASTLFEAQCSSCHGATGQGNGVNADGQEPPPTNFYDRARQEQRSIFGLYNVISNGVEGTAMPSFAALTEAQRWGLAFYVGQLIYSDSERQRGADLIAAGDSFGVDNLGELTQIFPSDMQAAHGGDGLAVTAYLRANPAAVITAKDDAPMAHALALLDKSLTAYRNGHRRDATDAALAAYLDGYELQEAAVSTLDSDLNLQIERAMLNLRQLIADGAPLNDVLAAGETARDLLQEANDRLQSSSMSTTSSFIGSFIILTREGLEAILVLAALFAFLGKIERTDARRYVHYGWIAALACGGFTWFAATYLISISGAGRELTEGFSALIAAAVLLSVGLWMHNKSLSGQWQRYIAQHMERALSRGSLWGIAALAFIATYREVFETVLFYQALWAQGNHRAILGGMILALIALLIIAYLILKASRRLPLQQFFRVSSLFIVALAIIFTGQGIQALQEAGMLGSEAVDFISVPLLGIYPNLQSLLSQLLVAVVVILAFGWNRRSSTT